MLVSLDQLVGYAEEDSSTNKLIPYDEVVLSTCISAYRTPSEFVQVYSVPTSGVTILLKNDFSLVTRASVEAFIAKQLLSYVTLLAVVE